MSGQSGCGDTSDTNEHKCASHKEKAKENKWEWIREWNTWRVVSYHRHLATLVSTWCHDVSCLWHLATLTSTWCHDVIPRWSSTTVAQQHLHRLLSLSVSSSRLDVSSTFSPRELTSSHEKTTLSTRSFTTTKSFSHKSDVCNYLSAVYFCRPYVRFMSIRVLLLCSPLKTMFICFLFPGFKNDVWHLFQLYLMVFSLLSNFLCTELKRNRFGRTGEEHSLSLSSAIECFVGQFKERMWDTKGQVRKQT